VRVRLLKGDDRAGGYASLRQHKKLRMPAPRLYGKWGGATEAWTGWDAGVQVVAGYEGSLRERKQPGVGQLWRKGHKGLRSMV
jgi:hypothetical protein